MKKTIYSNEKETPSGTLWDSVFSEKDKIIEIPDEDYVEGNVWITFGHHMEYMLPSDSYTIL
jgi:hypothetical protein